MKVNVELVTRNSKKSGNPYTALEMTFENGYKKLVFLDNAEIYMLSSLAKSVN